MSGDQPPPVGPGPSDDLPEPARSAGEPGAGGDHPASGMPLGQAVNPYGGPTLSAEPEQPRLQWILVVVGIPIGFVAWVLASFLLLAVTGTLAGTSGNNVLALVLLVALLAASVGLIVWRRTRRLAQGFVLGAAIGLVVAGGLCIPLVSSF